VTLPYSPLLFAHARAQAGDKLAAEAEAVKATGDPAGFNLIDVLAWGSLGHALAYTSLAVQSFSAYQ